MSTDEINVVVDEEDNVLEYKKRSELLATDRIRITVIWIESSWGEVLLVRRTASKKSTPTDGVQP